MKLLLHARRGHSQLDHIRLGAPLARGAEAPEVVRAQGHMHSRLFRSGNLVGLSELLLETIFFLPNCAFLQENYHPSASIGATGTHT